jgi:hypothetical protein
MKRKKPTCTSLVEESLRKCDGFMTMNHLCRATGQDTSHVCAALFHLGKHRVVDYVVETDGVVWYFALPPDWDNRLRKIQEIKEDVKRPRRKRKNVDSK